MVKPNFPIEQVNLGLIAPPAYRAFIVTRAQ